MDNSWVSENLLVGKEKNNSGSSKFLSGLPLYGIFDFLAIKSGEMFIKIRFNWYKVELKGPTIEVPKFWVF